MLFLGVAPVSLLLISGPIDGSTAAGRSEQLTQLRPSRVEELQGTGAFEVALSSLPDDDIAGAQLSVVSFSSPMCRKCKAFAPRFERLAHEFQSLNTRFFSVNAIRNLDLFESEGVGTLPTVAIYVGRQMVRSEAVGRDTRADAAAVRDVLRELQALTPKQLAAQVVCVTRAREKADEAVDSTAGFMFGLLATGGAIVRLVAAMGEFGGVAEVTPAAQAAAVGWAECVLECATDLELSGLESLGP